MSETINIWFAIFMIAEFFCLGGILFTKSDNIRYGLKMFMILWVVIAIAMWGIQNE